MPRQLAIIQGHPDPAGGHLCHALADAYAESAIEAGHQVDRIELAKLDFPMVRTREEFQIGQLPDILVPARDAILAAEHLVMVFPLWHGTMPALVKAFLEQIMRPGFAMEYSGHLVPRALLKGRSARLVVTMTMPALVYRWYFRAHGVRGLERSVLRFAGVKPVRETLLGMVETSSDDRRAGWLERMRHYGRRLV